MSNSGVIRPLARYAAPIPWMNVAGEWEMLSNAFGLSFPHTEVAGPITLIDERSECSTS